MRSSFKAQTHGSELDATCTTPAIALVNAEVVRDVRTTPKIHIQIERGESKIQKRIEAMNALQMKVHTHTPTRTHTHPHAPFSLLSTAPTLRSLSFLYVCICVC